jgi:cytochrome c peroxidase
MLRQEREQAQASGPASRRRCVPVLVALAAAALALPACVCSAEPAAADTSSAALPRSALLERHAGQPPALAPGEAPPLPKSGPLAEPRSQNQAGIPAALTAAAIPPDSPQAPAAAALGQKLFFENRLSGDGSVACATCHDPARAFTDGRPTSIGIHGRVGQRNAPTILNALYNKTQFWDGRVATLEEQAALPITNPFEMGSSSIGEAVSKIASDADYQRQFMLAFGSGVNEKDMLRAIAAYERTLISFDSPFDRFIAGDKNAIGASAARGWELFNGKARCNLCHALTDKQRDVTVFTDNDFHNIGIGILRHRVAPLAHEAERDLAQGNLRAIDDAAVESEFSALGRFLITKQQKDIASFKTPDLRNVLVTAPYFHDGSQQTLWDTMDHYNKGDGANNPWLDEDIRPLALTEPEIDDLVAFLASLTSPQYKELGDGEFARQLALSNASRPQRDTARAFSRKPARPPQFMNNNNRQ